MAADGRGTRALPAPRGGAAWLRARLCLCEQRAESERDRAAFCAHPGWPFETLDGLHEHERRRAGFVQGGIDGLVAQLFARPDELVFGDETANQAAARFGAAVDGALESSDGGLFVVAHRPVIVLLVAARTGAEPLPL